MAGIPTAKTTPTYRTSPWRIGSIVLSLVHEREVGVQLSG